LEAGLNAVSCTSASACTAVGWTFGGGGGRGTLAERWNGTNWSIEPTPKTPGGWAGSLGAVSCTSASACTAIGSSLSVASWSAVLVERWNGTEWSIERTPSPTGSYLYGVSCSSASACTAVGTSSDDGGYSVTLAERWNGTRWSIEHTPNLISASNDGLSGVSCAAVSACTAVGPADYGTLAERWNGHR
jgi:hypothetical protein